MLYPLLPLHPHPTLLVEPAASRKANFVYALQQLTFLICVGPKMHLVSQQVLVIIGPTQFKPLP